MNAARYDLALLDAARGGDRQAILSLLVAAQPDIRRYARRSCNASADVDDAVQETLWLLYRRIGSLRTLGSVSGWLLTIVRRECQRLGARLSGRHVALDEAIDDPRNEARLSRMPQHELRIDVSRAIQSLPVHYREIVVLRDIEEMTIDEIADALALSRESVKGRLHRARALLREYLMS
jgi:RNA polymerase sigma-70 factor (ECF subfamily)